MQSAIAANWAEVRRRIEAAARRAGRDPGGVVTVAVTKTAPADLMAEALAMGLANLGENRVQEALAKQAVLGRSAAAWHLVGTLQTNKARKAAEAFDLIHSLDRLELAQALARAGEALARRISVLIQVNVSGEVTKHGVAPDELPALLDEIKSLPALLPCGLMTIAPQAPDPESARPVFRRLRQLWQAAADDPAVGPHWQWLSMGMSGDFEVAVEEGANLLRIGTAIFGER